MSVIKFQRDTTDLFNYPSDQNPTTQEDYIRAVKNWQETERNLVDSVLWQPETDYAVGAVIKTPSLPPQYILVCTQEGTSGTEEPDYTDVSTGYSVSDGTAIWRVETIVSLDKVNDMFTNVIELIESGEALTGDMWSLDVEGNIVANEDNIVPKTNGVSKLGTAEKRWGEIYVVTPTKGNNSEKVANTRYVQAELEDYLSLSGGTVTGNINGVTAPAGDISTKFATTEFVREAIRQHGNVPVGFEYFSFNPSIPQGSLPLLGGVYDRATYPDLWAWVQTQTGYLKTEAEWQTLSTANNGNVPYYSSGDGSTTFRVPSLRCWVKGANGNVSEVGSYLAAGLPNIQGSLAVGVVGASTWDVRTATGAFSTPSATSGQRLKSPGYETRTANGQIAFNASNSNSIYGNANTVQPESIVGLWLVKAYGTIVDTGQIDEQQYIDDRMADIKNVYLPANYLPLVGGNITGSLTVGGKEVERVNASGTDYIRYDSGLQICWGNVTGSGTSAGAEVTFPVPFSSVPIVTATANSLTSSANHVSVQVGSVTKTSCSVSISVNATWTSASVAARYIAIGHWK